LDVPFTQALQVVSRWGSGAKVLAMAMEKERQATAVVARAPAPAGVARI